MMPSKISSLSLFPLSSYSPTYPAPALHQNKVMQPLLLYITLITIPMGFFLMNLSSTKSSSWNAGASYVSTVQAALPRLVGAAAPAGAGAQENRRQCRKVTILYLKVSRQTLLQSTEYPLSGLAIVAREENLARIHSSSLHGWLWSGKWWYINPTKTSFPSWTIYWWSY